MTEKKAVPSTARRTCLMRALYAEIRQLPHRDAVKAGILESYGVSSTKELTEMQLQAAVENLRKGRRQKEDELSKARKRVIAAICTFVEEVDDSFASLSAWERVEKAKRIATRAAQAEEFNAIAPDKLRGLYSAFCNRTKIIRAAVPAVMEVINKK